MNPARLCRALEPHLASLHRLSRRLARTRSGADALAQEALVAAFRRRRRLRDPARARAFLLSLARAAHTGRVDPPPPLLVIDPDGVALALRELPEPEATALWLSEVEGLSETELATVMGVPARAALDLAARARVALARFDVPAGLRAVPLATEPAPPSLEATLRGLAAGAELALPRGAMARALLVPALAALAAAVAVGYTRLPGFTAAIPDFVTDEVAAQHVRALSHDAACEKESANAKELGSWLEDALGRAVQVPVPHGGELWCARRGFLFGQPTPAVVYHLGGAPVTLFLPGPGSAAAAASARSLGHCAPGTNGQTVCVLPGPDGPRLLAGELAPDALAALLR